MTRDLSACGVFLETTLTFVLGEYLRLTLVLEHVDSGHRMRMQCQGLVIRLEPCGIGVGIAMDIMAYRLD